MSDLPVFPSSSFLKGALWKWMLFMKQDIQGRDASRPYTARWRLYSIPTFSFAGKRSRGRLSAGLDLSPQFVEIDGDAGLQPGIILESGTLLQGAARKVKKGPQREDRNPLEGPAKATSRKAISSFHP